MFVGNVPQIDEPTFRSFFEPYGTIVDLVCNPAKRYGFVTYTTEQEANLAIQELAGVQVNENGDVFNVKLADNQGRAAPGSQPPPQQAKGGKGVVVAPPPYGKGPPQPYGKGVVQVGPPTYGKGYVAPPTYKGDPYGKGGDPYYGKGGDHYGDPYGKGGDPYGKGDPWGKGDAYGKGDPYGKGGDAYGKGAPNGKGSRDEFLLPGMKEAIDQAEPNSKLYVKGLPLHADDLYLYRVFAAFGAVLNIKCVHQDNWTTGFVQYASAAEAQAAIAGVSAQSLVDGTILDVSVKTAKKGGK